MAENGNGSADFLSKVYGVVATGVVGLAILLPAVLSAFVGAAQLELVVAASTGGGTGAAQTWTLAGRVLHDGEPVRHALVWAVASDDRGNRYTPPAVRTDSVGAFVLSAVPISVSGDTADRLGEVTVYARAELAGTDSVRTARGRESLALGGEARVRWVQPTPLALLSMPTIFFFSIVLALTQVRKNLFLIRLKYYGSVLLAFLFTAAMVAFIAVGLRRVNVSGSVGDVFALGFANAHHGAYVKDVAPEWVLSLTAPHVSPATATLTGFGAPLWVLLIAVLGSGVLTVLLIVKQISDPPDLMNDKEVRARAQGIVTHQFYILFAPLGAIIVYQLMVAGGAAGNQATVAVAALAAGVALNWVLDRALKQVKALLEKQ